MKKIFLLLVFLLLSGIATAQIKLIQNTAINVALGPFVDPADGTAETGLTISQADVRLKKNAADWGQKNDANACTHEENGWYECALNTTDTNTIGILVVAVNETGALPVWIYFEVIPTASHDLIVGGNVSSGSDLWNVATSSITAGIGLQIKTNLDLPVSYAGGVITSGSAQAGGANTITLATTAPTVTLVRQKITLLAGSGTFQSGIITAYDTSTKVATVQDSATGGNWTTAPASGTVYVVHDASAGALVDNILSAAKIAASAITSSEAPNLDASITSRLAPTVAGRTLGVSVAGTADANVIQYGGTNGTFSAGRPEVNTTHLAGTAQTGRDIGASVLLSSGTGTGQVKLSSGYVAPNWGDVGNPTTSVNLSATTVSTVSGNVTGTIGGLTAAALADFFDTNSGTTYASAVAGSVVKETADNAGGSALTVGAIADGVWDEAISGHLGAGSTGASLNAAGTAADPWSTAVPGAYGAGTAGYIIGNNLDIKNSDSGSIVDFGIAQAGAATTITLAAGASGVANFYRDKRIVLTGGTGDGQSAIITAYDQTTKIATIFCEGSTAGSWFTNPASGTTYVIVSRNRN